MPLNINPNLNSEEASIDLDALDASQEGTASSSLIAWEWILFNCGPEIAPLRNQYGYPVPGSQAIYEGLTTSSARPEDVVAWGVVAEGAMNELTDVRNSIVAITGSASPNDVQKFLDDYQLFKEKYEALIAEEFLVTSMTAYNATSTLLSSDHEIAVSVYNFAQETHCFTTTRAIPFLNELKSVYAPDEPPTTPKTDENLCPCPDPSTAQSGKGFPWWILLVAAGGYGYYKYRTTK